MMDPVEPPSYEESVASGVSASASCINEGFKYEDEDFETNDEGFAKPPTAPTWEPEPQERDPIINLGENITEEDIREACIQYVSEHCCYGKKFVRDTELKDISPGCTFHYKLESFGEKRESVSRCTPFYGQYIDGPENGPAPAPWDMNVARMQMFKDNQVKVEIPHTAVVKVCSRCDGAGKNRCSSCYGNGYESCWSCNGRGRDNEGENCSSCSGSGRRMCFSCSGTGRVTCSNCDGHGKMKHYRMLIVTWKNHIDNFVPDTLNLPRELILEVTGREIFREEKVKVYPIGHAPDASVNAASAAFVRKHETAFPFERILMQRHVLRAVPLTKINYSWKSKEGEFYIYGFDRKVYFEDYPQKCCCCTCL